MKLSISNIGWTAQQDETVYERMKQFGYSGLEIAPTRIFPDQPYRRLEEAQAWSGALWERYGFSVPSIQSIWFGRSENLFHSQAEREALLEYTRQAIDFAAAIGCGNLVFGCPKNRSLPEGASPDEAVSFFRELGDYAARQGTVIGMEANPAIYGTNYINDTPSALELIRQVDSRGFRLNLDVGTVLHNEEDLSMLEGNISLISHVHISEPGLKPIQPRPLHSRLRQLLLDGGYSGFVSVEMGKGAQLPQLEDVLQYVRSIFL